MKTSIIIPTLCRPTQLRTNVERLLRTIDGLSTEVIVVAEVDERAIKEVESLPVLSVFNKSWRGSVAGWNAGASLAHGDLLVTGADDIWWHDEWLQRAIEQMDVAGTCYCGLNDLEWNGWDHDPTHWVITRQGIIDYCGGCLMPPVYKTTFADNEIAARIKRAGQFTWCKQAYAEHMHFSNGKAPVDKGYLTMSRYYHADKAVYDRRKAEGFRDDFQAVVR